MSETQETLASKEINNYWTIRSVIGKGGFGTVYSVRGRRGESAVAKVPKRNDDRSIPNEISVFDALEKNAVSDGFPALLFYGLHGKKEVMIISRLGKSLKDVLERQGRLSIRRAAAVIIQLLKRLETLHTSGFLHLDLNHGNIMLGHGRQHNIVFLIDFGLAQPIYRPGMALSSVRGFVGHQNYASLRAHECKLLSPRDDLEQLVYLFVKMVRGVLPWEHMTGGTFAEKLKRIEGMKREYRDRQAWEYFPSAMKCWFRFIWTLRFYETPDYRSLISELRRMLRANNWTEELPDH